MNGAIVAPRLRRGFSLIELVAVLVVLGVLAASAIPAGSAISDLNTEAVRTEVRASLIFARETAAATGLPTGVQMNTFTQRLGLLQITAPSQAPSTMLDSGGLPRPEAPIDRNGGPGFDANTGTGSGGTNKIVWFGLAGVPEHRDSGGAYQQDAPGDIVISFTKGQPLTVRAYTGLVE